MLVADHSMADSPWQVDGFTHTQGDPPTGSRLRRHPDFKQRLRELAKQLLEGDDQPSPSTQEPSTPEPRAPLPPSQEKLDAPIGVRAASGGPELTEERKLEIEECGRRCAQRELERLGYVVEQMAFENPGYDLLAKRDGKELHVEVKAHTGRASIVQITIAQYREYLKSGKEYHWELWNVENVDTDFEESGVATRYGWLPDEALDVRLFRLDLAKCESMESGW